MTSKLLRASEQARLAQADYDASLAAHEAAKQQMYGAAEAMAAAKRAETFACSMVLTYRGQLQLSLDTVVGIAEEGSKRADR